MKRKWSWVILLILLCGTSSMTVFALGTDNQLDDYNFNVIEEYLENQSDVGDSYSFTAIVKLLIKGDFAGVIQKIGQGIGHSLFSELNANRKIIVQLILIAVISAIFSNFSNAFANSYVGESGFFVTYLLIFSMLVTSYLGMVRVAGDAAASILEFMKALVPTFALAITMTSGPASSIGLYQGLMVAITIAEWVIVKGVIPLCNIYLIVSLINRLDQEERFTKLAELIKSIANWILKSIVALIVGYHALQSMLLPAIDSVKSTAFQKGIQALPGAGKAAGAIASTILGSGVIIKNSIGAAGFVLIIAIIAIPVIKIFIFSLCYRLTAALLQPVTDERIVECLNSTSESAGILLQAMIAIAVLFMVSIAIIAASTNMSYYAG